MVTTWVYKEQSAYGSVVSHYYVHGKKCAHGVCACVCVRVFACVQKNERDGEREREKGAGIMEGLEKVGEKDIDNHPHALTYTL